MSAFVERYQEIYQKDPGSKVFAPLAEAYRRMGLLDEAIELAETGVKKHPHFSSGRVALGKCYAQKGKHLQAIEHLKSAVDVSPENILAHQLLAESYSQVGKWSLALQSYKMVLFLNPNDEKIASIVQKLEKDIFFSDSKSHESSEEFSMQKLAPVSAKNDFNDYEWPEDDDRSTSTPNSSLERDLAHIDIQMERGEWSEAKNEIARLFKKYPSHKEIQSRRQKIIDMENEDFCRGASWIEPVGMNPQAEKRLKLEGWLEKITARRKS